MSAPASGRGETKFTLGGSNLLGHRGQRRNPANRRIDNRRRARADVLHGSRRISCRNNSSSSK
jgi:hypothetical protein